MIGNEFGKMAIYSLLFLSDKIVLLLDVSVVLKEQCFLKTCNQRVALADFYVGMHVECVDKY